MKAINAKQDITAVTTLNASSSVRITNDCSISSKNTAKFITPPIGNHLVLSCERSGGLHSEVNLYCLHTHTCEKQGRKCWRRRKISFTSAFLPEQTIQKKIIRRHYSSRPHLPFT